jgi:hypothetical protein
MFEYYYSAMKVEEPTRKPNDSGDAEWRAAAYKQFLRDDAPGDAVYDEATQPPNRQPSKLAKYN